MYVAVLVGVFYIEVMEGSLLYMSLHSLVSSGKWMAWPVALDDHFPLQTSGFPLP